MAARSFAHRVIALAYDRLCTFEFGIAVELFGLPRPELPHWYDFAVAGVEDGPLRAIGGLRVDAAGGLGLLRRADTIIIPGGRGIDESPPPALLRSLVRAHERGARILSFCSGAFVLAEAGLLDGRRATMHWRYSDTLAARYPNVQVDPGVLYVDEGSLLTSAGSAAGIDLCLYVIRQDFGVETANCVARRLVVPPHREGGQSQFIQTALSAGSGPGSIVEIMEWSRGNLQEDLSVARLARRAGMSARTFARQFRATTGTTPHRWLTRQRVLAAQSLLERTDDAVESVAFTCGFGSALTLRHHFRRIVGVSPTSYRGSFRAASS